MKLIELQKKHPRFFYKSYSISRRNNELQVVFKFTLEPNIDFESQVFIPVNDKSTKKDLSNLVFQLGLIDSLNYWKATCSPEIIIEAGGLNAEQLSWWKELVLNGLGEFFYNNKIDFTDPKFVRIEADSPYQSRVIQENKASNRDLIMVGGGKESVVTLEILKKLNNEKKALLVNPIRSAVKVVEESGYEYFTIRRTLDSKLFTLNKSGYLNGHVPFSAYLAFAGILFAYLNDYSRVIVSNEASASEGNLKYLGREINHQYSKTYAFEKLFRDYLKKYLLNGMDYFSFLRPLNNLQTNKYFSKLSKYHNIFLSCNIGGREGKWCGNCSKCAFVYLSLFPFIPYNRMISIFKEDFFLNKNMSVFFKELTGLTNYKPFECVGTIEEAQIAAKLSLTKYNKEKGISPQILTEIVKELEKKKKISDSVLSGIFERNFLPKNYYKILIDSINE